MAKNVTSADIFGGMFQNLPGYQIDTGTKGIPPQESAADGLAEEKNQKGGAESSVFKICYVKRSKLHEFHHHPYRVTEDDSMQELAESIRAHGIQEPLLLRCYKDIGGDYEIIAGHRRNYAAGLAGLDEVPAYILDLDDDTAAELMVDSNNKREVLLPSEKAWAYRIKAEAQRRQGKRTDLLDESGLEEAAKGGMEEVGSQNGDSKSTVKRYIRLTYLHKELLDLVDQEKLNVGNGYTLSFFNGMEQVYVLDYYRDSGKLPNTLQIQMMMKYHKEGTLDADMVGKIMRQEKQGKAQKAKFTLKGEKIRSYFPQSATPEYMEQIIMELLARWSEEGRAANKVSAGNADEEQLEGQLEIEDFPELLPDGSENG